MLFDRHRAKIVSAAELLARLGPRGTRRGGVVLCHGVFDIVHPGHLRHLLYAKGRAEGALVASITADCHVKKGAHRPHVPQELRAQNLAVLDFVDYVVVNDAEDPCDLIRALQPDYYAKGFEYSDTARPGRTLREAAAVQSYGGEMLFTPGDIVYSSSALIEANAPDLRYEKLRLVMRRVGLSFDDLRYIVDKMRGQRVHVVGDVIVDALLHCSVIGSQAKTPTLSVRRDRREEFVGGAAVVAQHARATGASVELSTVVGGDQHGKLVLDELETAGVVVYPIVEVGRPTTCKEVVVVGDYRMLKLDTVDNRTISDRILEDLCASVRDSAGPGAVVYSDFRHGIFNKRTIPDLVEAASGYALRVADSQVASRWGNITEFHGFDLVTPNEREARFALADQDSGVRPLASRLYDEIGCKALLLKMGARGVLGCTSADHEAADSHFSLESFAHEVRDPVGAGDALLAWATLSMLVRPCPVAAAILGSFAAGVACEYEGNVPVPLEHVLGKVDEAEKEVGYD